MARPSAVTHARGLLSASPAKILYNVAVLAPLQHIDFLLQFGNVARQRHNLQRNNEPAVDVYSEQNHGVTQKPMHRSSGKRRTSGLPHRAVGALAQIDAALKHLGGRLLAGPVHVEVDVLFVRCMMVGSQQVCAVLNECKIQCPSQNLISKSVNQVFKRVESLPIQLESTGNFFLSKFTCIKRIRYACIFTIHCFPFFNNIIASFHPIFSWKKIEKKILEKKNYHYQSCHFSIYKYDQVEQYQKQNVCPCCLLKKKKIQKKIYIFFKKVTLFLTSVNVVVEWSIKSPLQESFFFVKKIFVSLLLPCWFPISAVSWSL